MLQATLLEGAMCFVHVCSFFVWWASGEACLMQGYKQAH